MLDRLEIGTSRPRLRTRPLRFPVDPFFDRAFVPAFALLDLPEAAALERLERCAFALDAFFFGDRCTAAST